MVLAIELNTFIIIKLPTNGGELGIENGLPLQRI